MRFLKTLFILCIGFFLLSQIAFSQTQVKVMSYNLLNFPYGEIPNRIDTLKKIVSYYQPDLFLLQELKNNLGLEQATEACNATLSDTYEHVEFVSQQSNPGSSWLLQQSLVYNTSKFGVKSQDFILTEIRDINEYILYLKDENLAIGGDTTFLYVYVTHLKSSQGQENENLRASMAQEFVDHLSTIPSDSYVLFGGDFNVYNSSEEAYQILLDESNVINLTDPIDMPGNWHSSSFPNKEILSQSTRLNQIYGDGAGGGLDDRFDFILMSENLDNPASVIHYIEDSYKALGNDGSCYNQDLLDCIPNSNVPDSVMRALYYMSDHLPIVMELEASISIGIPEKRTLSGWSIHYSSDNDLITLNNLENCSNCLFELFDTSGRVVFKESLPEMSSGQLARMQLPSDLKGLFIARITGNSFSDGKKIFCH